MSEDPGDVVRKLEELFPFEHLDEEKCSALREEWTDKAKKVHGKDSAVLFDIKFLFDKIEAAGYQQITECSNQSVFYVVSVKEHIASLIELIPSKKGKDVWIKMMDIYVSPTFDPDYWGIESNEIGSKKARLLVFSSAIMGIFLLTAKIKKSKTIKLYGRTDALFSFLKDMAAHEKMGNLPNIRTSIQGRWLVFEPHGP